MARGLGRSCEAVCWGCTLGRDPSSLTLLPAANPSLPRTSAKASWSALFFRPPPSTGALACLPRPPHAGLAPHYMSLVTLWARRLSYVGQKDLWERSRTGPKAEEIPAQGLEPQPCSDSRRQG